LTRAGLRSGDPCAADGWTAEQRVRALAAMQAEREDQFAPLSIQGAWKMLTEILDVWPGFRRLVHQGAVVISRGR
jgi:hypothetical protein